MSFGQVGMPGSNPGGVNMAVPSPYSSNTPAIGGGTNTFLPAAATGQSVPSSTSPINSTATSTGVPSFANLPGLLGFGQGSSDPTHDITKALGKAGFSAGIAGELADFLQSGAGFSPDVVNAMIAAMQPGILQGEANISEQFSNMGMRGGSPAAYAMGNYMSNVQLNEGQIWAGMYEQSVQNYMNVLLAGKGNPPQNTFQNLMQYMNTASGAAKNFSSAFTSGGQ